MNQRIKARAQTHTYVHKYIYIAPHTHPHTGLLFKYGVDVFNEEAERQDRMDGYIE